MKNVRAWSIKLAVIGVCMAPAALARGQGNRQEAPPLAVQKGDTVVARGPAVARWQKPARQSAASMERGEKRMFVSPIKLVPGLRPPVPQPGS